MASARGPPNPHVKFPVRKLNYFNGALLLSCVDFPIYYLESISERHIVLAGGGGSSNTGVHNQINILEIVPTQHSCETELVLKYHTPKQLPTAIMTGCIIKGSTHPDFSLTTVDDKNVVRYDVALEIPSNNFTVSSYSILRDPVISSDINCIKCDGRFSVLTGGLDGQLAYWKFGSSMKDAKIEHSVKAHDKVIDEIDINPFAKQLLTLSRDENQFIIWNLNDFKVVKKFNQDIINDRPQNQTSNPKITFRYRSCRFLYDKTASSTNDASLLIACNPPRGSSLVYKLSPRDRDYQKVACQSVTTDGISAMNISEDGNYFAIGTRAGGVSVFDTRKLRSIYRFDSAHHNAVTRLEFLPAKPESLTLTNSSICPLISASIDRQVILHRPSLNSLTAKSMKILLMAMFLFFAFVFLHNYYIHESIIGGGNRTATKAPYDEN